MADPSQLLKLAFRAAVIVDKGLKHRSTARNFISTVNAMRPILDGMEQYAGRMGFPDQKEIIKRSRIELEMACRKYTKVGWLTFGWAPYYHDKLKEAEKSIKETMLFWMSAQTWSTVQTQFNTANEANHIGDPESPLQLNAPLMSQLKSYLMRDGGDPVFNLRGFAGSGKTTLAEQLGEDSDVQGRFKKIIINHIGSKIESINGDLAKKLINKLRKNSSKAVLLVLDNVELRSEQLVHRCREKMSNSKSKILVISRDELQSLGTRESTMKKLGKEDAIKLLRHFVQSGGQRLPLQKVVSSCGRYPIEIKLIGTELRGEPIEHWQIMLSKWPQRGDHDDTSADQLLSRVQHSLRVSEKFQKISEFFMDLGLFPKDEMIPVTALIDMWVELYQQLEDNEKKAMIQIRRLTDMNLAELEEGSCTAGSDVENYYNNDFLHQHEVLREVAIRMSREEPLDSWKRVIIDMTGNQSPQWWPQNNQLNVAAPVLSMSIDQKITPDWCNIQETGAVVLVLNLMTTEYTLPEFINQMGNLKVLILTNYGFHPAALTNIEVLGSLRRLKTIRLQHVSVPSLCNLTNVHKLSFYKCQVKRAFKDSSIDEFSRAMPNLTVLNIELCEDFVKFPVGLCNVVNLTKLNISSCCKFTTIPEEIGRLENLELLWITDCPKFKKMPVSITELRSLSSLNISYCGSLKKLPDNIGELLTGSLKLFMEGLELKLPSSVNMGDLQIFPLTEGIQALSLLD